jgi:hypothetical protein
MTCVDGILSMRAQSAPRSFEGLTWIAEGFLPDFFDDCLERA